MKQIVLATRNKHKMTEFKTMLDGIEILSLDDIGFVGDIDETGETCEENAKIKTHTIREFLRGKGMDIPVVADDSGIFVNALGGEPGVHSARYADDHNNEANRQKVLKNLESKTDRSAYFKCIISYEDANVSKIFDGRTYGEITKQKRGDESFCYDCIFFSSDLGKTFGESTEKEKDSVSHRGRAVQKLKEFLKNK
jgi:XTP/dITP diphosphohydrolase